MSTVFELKEQPVTDTPLLVFDCVLPNGQAEHWCTHHIELGGTTYSARVLQHSAFDLQTASDQGVDGSPRISILLANADSHFSEIQQSIGWKGAALTVAFLFYDLRNQAALTDIVVVFQGICNPPDQMREATFRLTASNRMNLQRLFLPPVRIQRRCPWQFPATLAQRTEAVNGGANGAYSLFYPCGYSADIPGGTGNLNNGQPFTSCSYTRQDCQARGMFTRFGGIEFVPPTIAVRPYGKSWQPSAVSVNQARYNDFVPMVYGTAWYSPLVVFARNDGNLTRMEVLLGIGQIQGILTVLVNEVEIPLGVTGKDMSGTGWYNVATLGSRDGTVDPNFLDSSGRPTGDPYGSMAYLIVVVPTRLNSGTSLPSLKVLTQGLILPTYGPDGSFLSNRFSSNPAWILLDILRRSGWSAVEIDIPSFAAAAAYCDEQINAVDLNGNPITLPRFQCNLILQSRRSGGDVVRGIRNTARLYLTYGPGGILQLRVENSFALQQSNQTANSNSTQPLNGGWPSYEFGDGSTGISGILRRPTGEPSVLVFSRSIADTPNVMSVEFQDALNGYQQDSYELINPDDVSLAGQQVSASLQALGIPNYDQAARILKFNLDKSVRGNTYIQFETSVKAMGIQPGDLITVTYLKEGFQRQSFRVLKISPATNYRTAAITAQIHDDAWYLDTNGQPSSASGNSYPSASGIGVPKPLLGSVIDTNGYIQFGAVESSTTSADGTSEPNLSISFTPPATATGSAPGIPLISLAANIGTDGTLAGGEIFYYAISGINATGQESTLSFTVRAAITSDHSSVTLSGLSFAPTTTGFHVYRGATPAQFFRIASNQPLATQFTDSGLANQLIAPPDVNYDHANFYWRLELQPEIAVTAHSATTVGNATLGMAMNRYEGMCLRITRGAGQGQERIVVSNDATNLTISSSWVVEPDATSFFTVAEAGWHFGAQTTSSPVQFVIPNLAGEVVQVTGRSTNVNNVECAPELSLVTRWQIGGAGTADNFIPAAPSFGLAVYQTGGGITVSGISFSDLTNTRTISSATLTVNYWDELQIGASLTLAGNIAASDQLLNLSASGSTQSSNILQIEQELLLVQGIQNSGLQYQVTRGVNGSRATAHSSGAPVYILTSQTVITPFPPEFFGSPYSGDWSFSVPLANARIASASLFVTNGKGNSPAMSVCFTGTVDGGLRTLSGGQYSIQVPGYLAVSQNAAPVLIVERSHAVRDIFAVVGKAADAPVQLQLNVNGAAYCQVTISTGAIISSTIDGKTLPPLAAQAQITLSVLTVGQTYPGSDLTVLIRL
jgi:putative tail protein